MVLVVSQYLACTSKQASTPTFYYFLLTADCSPRTTAYCLPYIHLLPLNCLPLSSSVASSTTAQVHGVPRTCSMAEGVHESSAKMTSCALKGRDRVRDRVRVGVGARVGARVRARVRAKVRVRVRGAAATWRRAGCHACRPGWCSTWLGSGPGLGFASLARARARVSYTLARVRVRVRVRVAT